MIKRNIHAHCVIIKQQDKVVLQYINKPKMAYSRDLPKMAVMDDHGLS